MRRLLIGLTLVLLLAVSIGVGVTVARWPHCRHLSPLAASPTRPV